MLQVSLGYGPRPCLNKNETKNKKKKSKQRAKKIAQWIKAPATLA